MSLMLHGQCNSFIGVMYFKRTASNCRRGQLWQYLHGFTEEFCAASVPDPIFLNIAGLTVFVMSLTQLR